MKAFALKEPLDEWSLFSMMLGNLGQ